MAVEASPGGCLHIEVITVGGSFPGGLFHEYYKSLVKTPAVHVCVSTFPLKPSSQTEIYLVYLNIQELRALIC